MDATTTAKAEIKAWERDFRAQNGRNPTVEDIKALPHIAEKYKLYKKLVKAAEARSAREPRSTEPPKTPPRARPNAVPPAALLPKSRPVASAADVSTNNPFSPVKRKVANAVASNSSMNPFLTPPRAKRAPSPDSPSPIPAAPAAAISKARKRLRGEPVSPSPNPREKRRRFDALHPPVNDPPASPSRSSSPPVEEGDSFVDDSPMKAPASGKAFKPLFEEASMRVIMPLSQRAASKTDTGSRGKVFARAKTMPGGLFGGMKKDSKVTQSTHGPDALGGDFTMEIDKITSNGKPKDKDKDQLVDGAQKTRKKRVLPGPKGLIPGKDDLFEANPLAAGPSSAPSRNTDTSRKRSISEATKDEKSAFAMTNPWDLLPPSPPPADDSRWKKGNGKGKAKARDMGKGKSKKAKLSPVGSDGGPEESSSEGTEIEIVAWRGRPRSPQPMNAGEMVLELDPEFQLHLHGRHTDALSPPASPHIERFEVDLPEQMRKVLALSPSGREREREEEDVVRRLMRGARTGGGDVWGPGEIGGEGKESDEDVALEDDWEGEGIPWEVAEL